jgi:hypothetical protein
MDERAWIGPAERAPAGWTAFLSLEAYLESPWRASGMVLDDRAAVLREADFLRVYAHSPLAHIERRVGPWRAGVGRTDPVWPRVTMAASDPCPLDQTGDWSKRPLPMTADYDEIAAALVAQPVRLDGISICVRITDGDLQQMWEDILCKAGAVLVALPDCASVRLEDDFHQSEHAAAEAICVRLTNTPWLFPASANDVAFSTSDSPWSVMLDISRRLRRGDREAE